MSAAGQANAFLANLLRLALVALLGTGGFLGWKLWHADAESSRQIAERDLQLKQARSDLAGKQHEIDRLSADVAAKARQIEHLELAMKLLKVERRMARVIVLDQQPGPVAGRVRTRVRFVEVDGEGNPLGEGKEAVIDGDLLYVDSWIVKFDDHYIEQGDPLRSASLCLFRRLFDEHTAPDAGVPLDAPGERPAAYGGGQGTTELEKKIWKDFWDIANDPKRAAELGIRAAHGEAPSMKLKKGEVYALTLRASGGLTIQPERAAGGN